MIELCKLRECGMKGYKDFAMDGRYGDLRVSPNAYICVGPIPK